MHPISSLDNSLRTPEHVEECDIFAFEDTGDIEKWLSLPSRYEQSTSRKQKQREDPLGFNHPGHKNALPTRNQRIRFPTRRLVVDSSMRKNYAEDTTPVTLDILDVATPHPDGDMLTKRRKKHAKCPTCRQRIDVVRKPFWKNVPDQQCCVCLEDHDVNSVVQLKCGHFLCPSCFDGWRRVCV